jgi:DUF1365 family protein
MAAMVDSAGAVVQAHLLTKVATGGLAVAVAQVVALLHWAVLVALAQSFSIGQKGINHEIRMA